MSREPVIRVRIDHIDWTLSKPTVFDLAPPHLPLVPVIRVFGASSIGPNACVHVHQVYRYIYVDYSHELDPLSVEEYLSKLARSLNYAISLARKQDLTTSSICHIRAITLVKGIHFYGFHASLAPFLKISLVDPDMLSCAVNILRSGVIMSTKFKVYEAHLSFLLQFLCDFNLHGCNWLDMKNGFVRQPLPSPSGNDSHIPLRYCDLSKDSSSPLEVDLIPVDILNRQATPALLSSQENDPTNQYSSICSLREFWEDERRRRVKLGLPPTPTPAITFDGSGNTSGAWSATTELWKQVRDRVSDEQNLEPSHRAIPNEWSQWIMTTYESVEALWENNFQSWRPLDHDGKELDLSLNPYQHVESGPKDWALLIPHDQLLVQADDIDDISRFRENEIHGDEDEERESDREEANDLFQVEEEPLHLFTDSDADDTLDLPMDPPMVANESSDALPPPTSSIPAKSTILLRYSRHNQPQNSHSDSIGFTNRNYKESFSKPKRQRLRRAEETFKQLGLNSYAYRFSPMPKRSIVDSCKHERTPDTYRDPFYSDISDLPNRPLNADNLVYFPQSSSLVCDQEKWVGSIEDEESVNQLITPSWEFIGSSNPPIRKVASKWITNKAMSLRTCRNLQRGKVLPNQLGGIQVDRSLSLNQDEKRPMGLASMELLTLTTPSDAEPRVSLLVYSLEGIITNGFPTRRSGVLALSSHFCHGLGTKNCPTEIVDDELSLINRVIAIMMEFDPDILTGWDLSRGSWGCLAVRAATYGIDLANAISRGPLSSCRYDPFSQDFKIKHFSPTGRHVLNAWRIIRGDRSLSSYSFEAAAFVILKQRYPFFNPETLSRWLRSCQPHLIRRLITYLETRTVGVLKLLETCQTVLKVEEFARTCGIDFFSALTRGSQFKVESLMARLTKSQNYVMLSPGKHDVGSQNAAECIPLIMEPRTAYYKSPVLVLDFQSLYPSMMIAYNYCYSTCLGRIRPFEGRYKLGVLDNLSQPAGLVEKLKEQLIIAPNGILYTKSSIRKGLLSSMLTELLNTRVMIKEAMKTAKEDKNLTQLLDARQISLKFVCNVTYGYTSASFSGRMPAVEIADSIVQSGRETLEKAIEMIEACHEWGGEVVYGDTDSIFVSLPGKSREEAFHIGNAIADMVTHANPPPVRLKFEKVYLPCILLAKKRYVGMKLERVDQVEPVFDAKGIETVRRDGIPAQVRLVERTLRVLFQTQDLSQVKRICFDCWESILDGSASLRQFIFSKEVKLGSYSDKLPPLPGVVVALREHRQNPAQQAHFGERIPYLIARGTAGTLLGERAFSPMEFLRDRRKSLDAQYYISRVLIPPLQRILGLIGVDVQGWYSSMTHLIDLGRDGCKGEDLGQVVMTGQLCLSCGIETKQELCPECLSAPDMTAYRIGSQLRMATKLQDEARIICQSCCGIGPTDSVDCVSIDCDWMFRRGSLEKRKKLLYEASSHTLDSM